MKEDATVDGVCVSDGTPPPLIMVERLVELRYPALGRRDGSITSPLLPWNWERYCQASDDAREVELSWRLGNIGFHSVGSRSALASWSSAGIRIEGVVPAGALVGVIGGTMTRGDMGGEDGGVLEGDMEAVVEKEAERGLQESLRRQLQEIIVSR